MADELELIEPVPVEDDFCCGLARIEDLGSNARFVLFTLQHRYEDGSGPFRVVKAKVVLPIEAIRPGIDMTLAFLAKRAVQAVGQRLLRLVKVA